MIDDKEPEFIEVDATDLGLGHDADGLPKTIPGEPSKKAAEKTEALEPNKKDPDVETLRRRATQAERQRDEAAAFAMAQQRRAQAATNQNQQLGQRLDSRTDQALRAHWRAVTESYDRAVADYQQVDANIRSTKALEDAATRELEQATQQQDGARMAAASKAIAAATSSLTLYEAQRNAAERTVAEQRNTYELTAQQFEEMRAAREQAAREPAPKQQPRQQPRQITMEQWIDQHPRKTAEWLHANKEFVSDRDKHEALLEFGREWAADYGQHTLHSPQFIEALEAKFGAKETDVSEADTDTKADVAEKAAPARSRAAAPAPVSRNSAPGRSSGDNKIRLTPQEHAIAPDVITAFEDLDPDFQDKFKAWSPTAARFQYERNKRKAVTDMKGIKG